MGDIDFEELDRAVSSLMNPDNDTAQNSADAESAEGVVDQSTSNQVESIVDDSSQDVEADERVGSQPTSLATRRSGRFMDVIPSQNSRPSARPVAAAPSSRVSPTMQPIGSGAVEGDLSAEPVKSHSTLSDLSANQDASDGSGTPFLEGVSVNKRPLGQPSDELGGFDEMLEGDSDLLTIEAVDSFDLPTDSLIENQPVAPHESVSVESDPWSAEPKSDVPNIDEELLRPELSPELLAVETMSVGPESSPSVSSPSVDKISSSDLSPAREVNHQTEAPSAMPGNINPQYNSAPGDAPEPSPIFEAASEAPQALAHPPKKKSGWSTVVWILLMVILGVAAGIAVWYFLVK